MDVRFFIKKYKAYIFIAYQESLVSFHIIFFFFFFTKREMGNRKWKIVYWKVPLST